MASIFGEGTEGAPCQHSGFEPRAATQGTGGAGTAGPQRGSPGLKNILGMGRTEEPPSWVVLQPPTWNQAGTRRACHKSTVPLEPRWP